MKKNERMLLEAAKTSLEELLDCMEGIVSEQGYEGLTTYVENPALMIAKARKTVAVAEVVLA